MTGQSFSHYRILEKLGEGGMGVVYRAVDTRLDRSVAIKVLRPEAVGTTERRQRFIREAKAASALNHHHIITIYDIGHHTHEGSEHDFIVMEHVEGKPLHELIVGKPLGADDALRYAIQIADALSSAHQAGIVHRDIKPANIMITDKDRSKILDFGLAKLTEREDVDDSGTTFTAELKTEEGAVLGTAAYMSPEQAEGKPADVRSDVFSFGVMLYEMLTGERPFKGDSFITTRMAILRDEPPPMKSLVGAVPPGLERIVLRCLEKKKEARYLSATELHEELEKYRLNRATAGGKWRTLLKRPVVAVPLALGLLGAIAATNWFFERRAKIRWATEDALPEIARLIETNWRDTGEPYKLAEEVEKILPDNPKLSELFSKCALEISIRTDPPGAKIFAKEYKAPGDEWAYLGVSPIENLRLPIGVFRWKIEKEGYEMVLAASSTWDIGLGGPLLHPYELVRDLDEKGTVPPGMVRVRGAATPLGEIGDFFIDTYEVTNRQYKEFIANGGYQNREYWKHELIKDGKVLSFEDAIAEFRDQTGRPGPVSWQAGDYGEGQGDYPVSGISWYEAAAYAEFVGKSLPTGHHWGIARGEFTPLIMWPQLGGYAIFAPFSNFEGKGPAPVGSHQGMTSYGAYDMAGNVREWCSNETPKGRLIRGGAWNDNHYMFKDWSQADPWDRSTKNGLRCAIYPDPEKIPVSTFGMVDYGPTRDFYEARPVEDSVFLVYKEQFSYDRTDLNARVESRDESSGDWIREEIAFDAAYGGERVSAHLFLPKNAAPPYQTVVYFPGSGSVFQESSKDIEVYFEFQVFLSYLIKNGRAVLYPVYKGTFERADAALGPIHLGDDSHLYAEWMIQLVKDLKRSIDYLETRQDIDADKIAYYGMSWGAKYGAIIPAVEERLGASVLVAGGLTGLGRPEVNQLNYITRVKTPTLMLNGRYDTIFPYETSIKPMFDLLGTPVEHKELKVFESDHIVPMNDFIRETLAWLDRYLGPVEQ